MDDLDLIKTSLDPDVIDWNELYKAFIISKSECEVLEELKINDEHTRRIILEDPNNRKICASAFLNLLHTFSRVPKQGHTLVALENLLEIHPALAKDLDSEARFKAMSIYGILFNLLHHANEFIAYMTAMIISNLILRTKCHMENKDLIYFLKWIKNEQKSCMGRHLTIVMRMLKTVLRIDLCRQLYYGMEGLAVLVSLLEEYDEFQAQYDIIFCLWLISFSSSLAEDMENHNIIHLLAHILDTTSKVKVMRIILATYVNLITKPSPKRSTKHCIAMMKNDVLKRIRMLDLMRLQDDEMLQDMAYIKEKLFSATLTLRSVLPVLKQKTRITDQCSVYDSFCKLQSIELLQAYIITPKQVSYEAVHIATNSFEEFAYEVTSGNLCWGPVHTSPDFWRENVSKLNENNFELIRLLLKWLDMSNEEEVISVACFDTGQYLQYYPQGKETIEQLGGKLILMRLINNKYSTVQYEALHTIQKLLLNNWDPLGQLMQEQLGDASHRGSS